MMKKRFTFLGGVIAIMLLSLPTWAYVQTQQRAGETDEPVTAPYTADFMQEDVFNKCIVIDANGDGNTWIWVSGNGARYRYHTTNNADDYLILPISLEANKNYNVFVSAGTESEPEKFEVKVGKVATPEGLDIIAISEVTFETGGWSDVDFEGSFTTDEAGTWYVAVHATSDSNKWHLYVKSLTVELGAEPTAPAAVEDLTATAGEEGALEVNLAFTAPAKAIDGTDLAGKESIKVYRDDVLVNTITDVEPGSQQTWKDTDVEDGYTYAYHVVPTNESGDGVKSEKVSVPVGQDTPADVENVKITGTTATTVTLTWDPVSSVGATGGYVNPEKVQYNVVELGVYWNGTLYEISSEPLITVTGETTATFEYPVEGEEQAVKYFGVKAVAGAKKSNSYSSVADLFVGAPYELPIEETFTGSEPTYFWQAGSGTDCSYSDGAMQFSLQYGASTTIASVESGKLNLKDTTNPTLMFDVKTANYYVDDIVVYGIAFDGTTSDIATFTMTDEYQTFTVAIPENLKNGDWARIGFKVDYSGWDPIRLDNIKVLDLLDNDLSVAVSAPASVEAGSKAVVTATVKNEGSKPATGYTVSIKAGDKELLNKVVEETLESFATAEVTADFETSVFDEVADITISAVVTYEGDEKAGNNTAETVISVVEPTVYGVTDVVAVAAVDAIEVSWTAPELVADIKEVTEGFEDGEGGWTFIDADEDGNTWKRYEGEWSAHSGSGYLCSDSWTLRPNTVDNWLVSPEIVLDGTFKFWAKGGSEHFQVYVSTESATDVSAFEPVSDELSGSWSYEEFEVDLSAYAGQAGWIAIRHSNSYWDLLSVDDITYLVSDGIVEIEKYNIYVDGELATTADADQTTVTVEDVKDGSHTVAVSVVYVNGKESKPVETTVEIATGLNKVTVVTKPVDVYSLDGKLVRKQATTLSGLKGIYIIDGKKVVLK